MHLLLLGCTGFIGSELVPQLLRSGHHLTIVSRKLPKKFSNNVDSERIIYLQSDPGNPKSWSEAKLQNALSQANGVINLAGEPIAEKRWTKKKCEEIKNSRIQTTRGLIETMSNMKINPQVLINASAIGYYGSSQNDLFTEENDSGQDFLAKLCKEWEEIASEKPAKTRLVLLRIGIVLGTNGGALGKMLPVFRAGFGGPIGNGQQWMSWIHRTDLCQMIDQALLDEKWEGIINAVSPNPSSMSDFSCTLGKVLGRPSLLPVPEFLLKLLMGDGAKVVLEGQKVSSNRLKKLKFNFRYAELFEALKKEASTNI
tara:strand:+ start:3153 stop:4091 length:939 start_codon:yes stop_codon:yes gene_type:complete